MYSNCTQTLNCSTCKLLFYAHVCQVHLLDCRVNFIFSLFSVRSTVKNRAPTGNLCLYILDCRCKEFMFSVRSAVKNRAPTGNLCLYILDCRCKEFMFSVRSAVKNRAPTGNLCLYILDCRCKEFTYKIIVKCHFLEVLVCIKICMAYF
jgi:hypothetical protein